MLTTGGTIAAVRGSDGGLAPAVDAADLRSTLPSPLLERVNVEARALMSVDSAAMDVTSAYAIARHVAAASAGDAVDGIVVTHGTDTMEETALLTDLVLARGGRRRVRVVFTGAQRGADQPGADGPGNLARAVDTASGPAADSEAGVLIAFAGRTMPAWGTRKLSTVDLDAFAAWPDRHEAEQSRRRALAAVPGGGLATGSLPRVDTVALYPGSDAVVIDACRAAGARGIVLEAMGAGNANAAAVRAVRAAAAAGVAVVVTTRVPHGPAFADYGGGGGGTNLARAGAVFSPVLRAGQARILLAALLAAGVGHGEVTRAFTG
ncbi:asparaginase domain-containing protein [Tomitella fengzijianii]|uniref:asparaginase domain-containing protein n=1 Tax=Tomitella fengzijianii TaxID=2597660 RepID=UPI0022A7125C|nr:asparaginase domain-containing protein [Tomitella fengzijianii]